MTMQGTPHRIVDGALDGLASGAKSLVQSISGGIMGAGENIQAALDKPPRDVGGPENVARVLDRALDGMVTSTASAVTEGIINPLMIYGEGLQRALDHPPEQFGVPPEIGTNPGAGLFQGLKLPKPPRIPR